jgi:hypothetical protein
MSVKVILKKIYRKIYYCLRRINFRRHPIYLKESLFSSFKSNCSFLYNPNNKDYFVSELNNLHLCSEIVHSADKICSHEFNFLGSDNRYLGEKLPWNEDFKTGFKWENKFYKDIKIVDLNNNADVKVPWELSRFQHLFTLGKAYWITANEKYAEEFKEEVQHWIKENPSEYSVNWTCTMDVSIRAVNLICAYYFFSGSASININFWNKFNNLLYTHGKFIYKNLENEQEYRSNHYLSDLAGLIWLGIYFVECNQVAPDICHEKWLRFALLEFENEMKKQINEDGTDYEGSTSYHRLVTEIFLITTILCNKNDIYFSKEYMTKLEKMCGFIMNTMKPSGLSPIIGDADDGRLIILSNYEQWEKRDFTNVLSIAGEYFNRVDFRMSGKHHEEDALWVMGSFKAVTKELQLSSVSYNRGGYYVLRNNRFYCMVRCGELSLRGQGGHSHNDQLSIELNVDGEDFIIDAGSYVYTADYNMRNLFRSTKMHNTLCIDNYEQNNFNEYDLFYMKEQSFGKCTLFNETSFTGRHYGFKKKCGVIHERKINLENNELIIIDKVIGSTVSNVYINFLLDFGVTIEEKQNGIQLNKNGKKIFIQFNNEYSITDAFVSYGYGQRLNTSKISIKLHNESSIKIKIVSGE